MTSAIRLQWEFHCKAKEIGQDHDDFLGKHRGIYLWLYRNTAACRVAYVGKAVSSPFKKRFAEHFRSLFGGGYAVFRIPSQTDYLNFYAENILTRRIGDKTLLVHEDICWYENIESPNYFRHMFVDGSKKRMKVLDHYLDHLEFAFATLPGSKQDNFSDDTKRAEAALGKGLHQFYLTQIPEPLRAGPIFPSGNSSDTIVGRHSLSLEGNPVAIEHSFTQNLESLLPVEVSKVCRYPTHSSLND